MQRQGFLGQDDGTLSEERFLGCPYGRKLRVLEQAIEVSENLPQNI